MFFSFTIFSLELLIWRSIRELWMFRSTGTRHTSSAANLFTAIIREYEKWMKESMKFLDVRCKFNHQRRRRGSIGMNYSPYSSKFSFFSFIYVFTFSLFLFVYWRFGIACHLPRKITWEIEDDKVTVSISGRRVGNLLKDANGRSCRALTNGWRISFHARIQLRPPCVTLVCSFWWFETKPRLMAETLFLLDKA